MSKLIRSNPRAEGVSPKALLDLLRYYDENHTGVQSIMVLRHDKVIAEAWWNPYRAEYTHELFSMSKSFTAAAIGFAMQEGLLSLDDRLISFFPDVLPEDSEPCRYMKELTIRDVLRMATGHVTEPSLQEEGKEHWMFNFLSAYIEKKPGTHYLYNTAGSYMLSAVVQKLTGETVEDYLKPRLFDPLEFAPCWWEKSPEGISAGGFGFNLITEDIAKFGIFLRNRGSYNGKQLLNADWIDAATAKQIDFVNHPNIDSRQGYGYQFWRCQPENSYRAAGAFAQFCIVLPDQEMVIAVTSGAQETQPVLTALWEILLPGVDREDNLDDAAVTEELQKFAASLKMPTVDISVAPKQAFTGRFYDISGNPIRLEKIKWDSENPQDVTLVIDGKENRLSVHAGIWTDGTLAVPSIRDPHTHRVVPPMDDVISSNGGWISDSEYELQIYYPYTPFDDHLFFAFEGDYLRVKHVRKTGVPLINNQYFGIPSSDLEVKKAEEKKQVGEFRF